MDGSFHSPIPYLYIAHIILIVSIRVGAALLFAPIWGYPGNSAADEDPAGVFDCVWGLRVSRRSTSRPTRTRDWFIPMEFFIGLLLSMGIRIAFAGLHMGGQLVSYHLGFSAVQSDRSADRRINRRVMAGIPDHVRLHDASGVGPAPQHASGARQQLWTVSRRHGSHNTASGLKL